MGERREYRSPGYGCKAKRGCGRRWAPRRDEPTPDRRAPGRRAHVARRARAPRRALVAGRVGADQAARARGGDHRLPRRGEPAAGRLRARRAHPDPAGAAPAGGRRGARAHDGRSGRVPPGDRGRLLRDDRVRARRRAPRGPDRPVRRVRSDDQLDHAVLAGPAAGREAGHRVTLSATHFTDPGCPWAYSASPALAVLRWRFGDAIEWRLATIGLTESGEQYERRGYTPARSARGYLRFRRYGMPFATSPRRRIPGTSRACRAIVATRLSDPSREYAAFRALQFGWFTTPLVLDEDADIAAALGSVPGLDVSAVVDAIDDPAVVEAYEADRAAARSAAGGATEAQGRAANTDGVVRFTAPSVVFEATDGRRLEAGGFQPLEAYDVVIANLDPTLPRRDPPSSVGEALAEFSHGLTTQEVAALMAPRNEPPDRRAAEEALIELAAEGGCTRAALGDDALWSAGQS